MKPSIGRIVIFHQGANEAPVNGTRSHPAIITRVWNDRMVNLHVFYDCMASAPQGSVHLLGSENSPDTGRSWSWPLRDEMGKG